MPTTSPREIEIREFTMEDYEEALALWRASDGIAVTAADSRDNLGRFLQRNPGLSFVARQNGRLVGAILGSHDGRRGYLHHLAVAPAECRRGVGAALAARCLRALRAHGIHRCHLFVHKDNAAGAAFWKRLGWRRRDDLTMMSLDLDPTP